VIAALARARGAWRAAAGVYLAQLVVAFVFMIAVEQLLAGAFATRPYFDRAVGGDLVAWITIAARRPDLLRAIAWIGLALAAAYALASYWLAAVLVGAVAGATERRGKIALAYLRLAGLTLVPYAIAAAFVFHACDHSTDEWTVLALDRWHLVRHVLVAAAPGLVLGFVTACVADYARVAIALGELRAHRAVVTGARTLVRRPLAAPLVALYLASWVGITAIYVAASWRIDAAIALFILRQLVCASRFGARVVAIAAQVKVYRPGLQMLEPEL
jgi:hypothetical protein